MILSEELKMLVSALETAGVSYAVCGGYAVGLHGYPRMTYDLDILVQQNELGTLETVVKTLGFDVVAGMFAFRKGLPEETRFWRVSKFDGPDHLVLDVLLVTPVFDEVWETRLRLSDGEQQLWVVSREGLAIMKKVAGRTKDLADLQHLGILPKDDEEPEQL